MDVKAFFKISYGLYIVSAQYENHSNGFISNSVFQVTAEPPYFAISCNRDNATAEIIKKSKSFSISVLEKDTDPKLIGLFGYQSGRDVDKFTDTEFKTGITGSPVVLSNTIAWIECELTEAVDVGTHIIFIGKVMDSKLINPAGVPLTYAYYRDVKKGVAPKNAPTYIDKSKLSGSEDTQETAAKYECMVCGYVYDPAKGDEKGGIPPGTKFEDLPDDWVCPDCSSPKSEFRKIV